MLREPVDEQDVGPGLAGRRPGADQDRRPVRRVRRRRGARHAAHRTSPDRYAGLVAEWTEVGDRVFVRRYRFYNQNIGVVLGDEAALVIDTRVSHRHATEIVSDLR